MIERTVNFNAFKYSTAVLDELIQLISPLFEFEITNFGYYRCLKDGRYLYLSNNLSWIEFYLENIRCNLKNIFSKQVRVTSGYSYHAFLWPVQKIDCFMSALYHYNLWNGLTVSRYREDGSLERWEFSGRRESEFLRSFFIENIEVIKDFIANFTLSAYDIILPEDRILAKYENFIPYVSKIDVLEKQKVLKFINATNLLKYPIVLNGKETALSKRELSCLHRLAYGETAKGIAYYLYLSPRTIEKHIQNIKSKLNCSDRRELIKIYKNSLLHWL